jgi:hypothetical protein
MTYMKIDTDVFNSAKSHKKLEQKCIDSADALTTFLEQIMECANQSVEPPYAEISIIPFTPNASHDPGIRDIVLACKTYEETPPAEIEKKMAKAAFDNINAAPGSIAPPEPEAEPLKNTPDVKVTDYHTLDFSFAVRADGDYIMNPSIKIRYNTKLMVDADGVESVSRQTQQGKLEHADHLNVVANEIFIWVAAHMPKKDRDLFIENCEKAGLKNDRKPFGFLHSSPQEQNSRASAHLVN